MNNEKLSTEGIEELLINKQFYNVNVEDCVDSTNEVVKRAVKEGTGEGYVVIANEQTAGKGRLGRSFYSPKDTGIYMSILLCPGKSADKSLILTSVAAISVCKAIREIAGLDANIKWVNDILIDDKKVCGILTEGEVDVANGELKYAIVGIGINISTPDNGFPKEIEDKAASLENSTMKNLKNRLVAKILDNISFYYNDIDLNEDVIRYEYIGCCSTIGKDINIINGSEITSGKAVGIADDMSLLVRDESGIRNINYGEISIRENK